MPNRIELGEDVQSLKKHMKDAHIITSRETPVKLERVTTYRQQNLQPGSRQAAAVLERVQGCE